MPRPVATPKQAAAVRRAGVRLLTECRESGTPVHEDDWGLYDAATIAKYLQPGDALIAQRAYRLCVAGMVHEMQGHGCTYPAAPRLERALADFLEAHAYAFQNGRFIDEHVARLAFQQQEQERQAARVQRHKAFLNGIDQKIRESDPELKQLLEAGA